MTYQEIKAQQDSEREIAQNYMLIQESDRQEWLTALPEDLSKRCIKYGCSVSWNLLPAEVKAAYAMKFQANRNA